MYSLKESPEKTNPGGNPPMPPLTKEHIRQIERDGGFGGPGLDVPTILRREQEHPEKLPEDKGPIKTYDN